MERTGFQKSSYPFRNRLLARMPMSYKLMVFDNTFPFASFARSQINPTDALSVGWLASACPCKGSFLEMSNGSK